MADGRLVRDEETGAPIRFPCCPVCAAQALDREGVPLSLGDLSRKRRVCDACGSPLWQADNAGPRRYPLADYVKHRMRGFFDLFVGDEVHEFKARGSAQGIAAGVLAESCGRSLTLSGTLMGGYASTLFHLLYRFSPEIRTEFGHSEEGRWISRYGFTEETIYKDDDAPVEDGRASRRRRYRKVVRERPGLSPSALFHLIGSSIFLRLSDVASGLPPYEERVLLSRMDTEQDHTGFSQRSAYDMLYGTLKKALGEALATGSKRLLATYLQTLLAYPDGCTRGETVFDPATGFPIAGVPPLSEERTYPKEQALVDLVAAERLEGRRVLVYATHTGTRDITERMDGILSRHGFRVAVMKADAVAPERREAWVAEQVEKGIDVLICHPRLVQTGLDLIDFPTICWYETDYSVYTMRQASRRSWRIGQSRPVRVVFMAYRNSLQADALKLVAKKLQSFAGGGGRAAGGRPGRLRRRRRRPHARAGTEDRERRRGRGGDGGGGLRGSAGRRDRPPRSIWSTTAGSQRTSSRRPSRSTAMPPASSRRCCRSRTTAAATRTGSRSRRCSPGPSSWPMGR